MRVVSCVCKKIEILKVSKLESSLVHAEIRSPTNMVLRAGYFEL